MSVLNGASSMEVDSTNVLNGNAAPNPDMQGLGLNGSTNDKSPSSPRSPAVVSSPEKASDTSNDSFITVSHEDTIVDCTFTKLIEKMRTFHYNIRVNGEELILAKCKLYFERDYRIKIVKNGNITDNYPVHIIVPVGLKDADEKCSMDFDADLYTQLVEDSRIARLRSRFIAPAILFDNKFICRSGTLTVWLSAMYEKIMGSRQAAETMTEAAVRSASNAVWQLAEIAYESLQYLVGSNVMEQLLCVDAKVLQLLKVEHICDLMVEYNKHFKQQVNVSSTEKVHEEIYKGIKMEEMPYPGCEFFAEYCEANRNPEGLVFDWSQSDVTRSLELSADPKQLFPDMDTESSKKWDLVQLTKNYLKIMLSCLVTGTGGLVVHCISGWDRTPLYVSLLRLSLWADGVVHQNLDASEMAYLTVAYDWFLFGHNLPDRLKKNEEVMHFCLNFLQYITSDDFSVTKMFEELPQEKKRKREFPKFAPGRREVLRSVRDLVLESYTERIITKSEAE